MSRKPTARLRSKTQIPPSQRTIRVNAKQTAHGLTRDLNRDLVLEVLRRNQPISRVNIASISGLQRSTVSAIIDGLIREKWISEGPTVQTARGRRPTMLTMNDDLMILVADVRPTQTTLAVIDLNGRFISRSLIPYFKDPKRGVQALAEGLQTLREQLPGKTFEGVGLSMPGRVDLRSQKLSFAPNLPWVGYDIRNDLQGRLGLQVELENAANACLLSEMWFGRLDGIRNAVLITISEGVGAAILVNGGLVEGTDGFAGELGHVMISETGPKCACGEIGCWEVFASTRAALRYFHELEPKENVATLQQLMSLETNGNKSARTALLTQAKAIGRGLRIATAALNPEIILFAGDLTLRWDLVGPVIEAEVAARMLSGSTPKVVALGDSESARLRGAAALVLRRHDGYQRLTSA